MLMPSEADRCCHQLDEGVLTFNYDGMWHNSTTPTCTEQTTPITVTELGRGFVIGKERVVSKVNRQFVAPAGKRGSTVYTYEQGLLVSTASKGPSVALNLTDGPDTAAGRQMAIIVWKTDDDDSACAGELLYNGICLPKQWPPLWDAAGGPPPRSGPATVPPYLRAPPARINVSLGRQLFVDSFLVESMPGLQLLSHSARWHGEVLNATEPWEAWVPSIPAQDYPQGPLASGRAAPFSGGLWWDENRSLFRVWYLCGSEVATHNVGGCYAESADGMTWRKPAVGTGDVAGTNIVHEELFNANVVWQDHDEADARARWKMATVPNDLKLQRFRLFVSPDGLNWTVQGTSGEILDRSTFFQNRFRRKWAWSIKEYMGGDRARTYVEGDEFLASAQWSSCKGPCRRPDEDRAACPCPWTLSDDADPRWPYNPKEKAQLYNLE